MAQWGKTELLLQRYDIEFYSLFAETCGRDIGFSQCGIAYIYTKPEAWNSVQPRIQAARELGTKIEVLDAQRARALLPYINFGETAGIASDGASIRVRASDTIPCMADQLFKDGVRFEFNCTVTGFLRNGRRVAGVRTTHGEYHAGNVVITAGAWSRPLIEKAGARSPTNAIAEVRYTTRPLPDLPPHTPLLIFSDYGFYIREDRGGLLISGGDSSQNKDRQIDQENPPRADRLPTAEAYRIRDHIREVERVMPVLKHAEVDKISGGIPTYTRDVRFIADRVPRCPRLYVITGCQEAGVTHSPGLGRIMADLVTDGKSTWDRSGYRLDRFV